MAKGADAVQAMQQAVGVLYGMAGRQAMMKAFIDNFWLLGVTFLAVIPLIFLMRSVGAHKVDAGAMH
jgi:DHA2 family multidrug resistance protein